MTVQNVNNKQATTTLNEPSNITAGTTAIDVDDNYATAGFPEAPFACEIDSELVLVTDTGTGTDWTIERGYGGSTAATHNDGVTLTYKLTAEWFTNAYTRVPQWIAELAERTDSYGAHALDDEFQDASIDGGYTLVQPSGTQTATEALDVLAVQPLTANNTDDIAAYVKSIASVSSPCTLETAVRFTNISSGNDYLMFGPLFSNGTTATTSNVMLAMGWTNATFVKFDGRYGVFTTIGTNEGFDVVIENTAWIMYLRVIWKTTNTFRVGFSTNGVTWKYSGDLSHTMTPTHIGVGWSTWNTAPESEEMLAFEYLRVTEADLSA